jgi:hypothetical protein
MGYAAIGLGVVLSLWMTYAKYASAKECRWGKVQGRVISSQVEYQGSGALAVPAWELEPVLECRMTLPIARDPI